MIVKRPIGAVKVGNTISRLTVGKEIPKDVFDLWKKTKQIDALKKGGFIGESIEDDKAGSLDFENKNGPGKDLK